MSIPNNADLSDEGLKAITDNLNIIVREFARDSGRPEDEATAAEVLAWCNANVELLRPLLHPRTAILLRTKAP